MPTELKTLSKADQDKLKSATCTYVTDSLGTDESKKRILFKGNMTIGDTDKYEFNSLDPLDTVRYALDVEFLNKIYTHPETMSHYAAGNVKTQEWINSYIQRNNTRRATGSSLGMMVVSFNGERIGVINLGVNGTKDEALQTYDLAEGMVVLINDSVKAQENAKNCYLFTIYKVLPLIQTDPLLLKQVDETTTISKLVLKGTMPTSGPFYEMSKELLELGDKKDSTSVYTDGPIKEKYFLDLSVEHILQKIAEMKLYPSEVQSSSPVIFNQVHQEKLTPTEPVASITDEACTNPTPEQTEASSSSASVTEEEHTSAQEKSKKRPRSHSPKPKI